MTLQRLILLLLPLAPFVACHPAAAASFDCSKAGTAVEKLICADAWLSEADSRLSHAYQMTAHDTPPDLRPTLVSQQKAWLADVRNPCTDVACLSRAYKARLGELTPIKTDRVDAEYVTYERELSSQVAAFEHALESVGLSGGLSCAVVVRLNIDLPSGKDSSYGALCQQGRREIMLCDDTLVGKLTVSFGFHGNRGTNIADFTLNNCPPGG